MATECSCVNRTDSHNDAKQTSPQETIVLSVRFESLFSPFKPIFFVCFVALRPKSTAMVMAERSVHLTTLFPGQA